MRAFGKNAEMSQVVAGEVKGREMFGHAIAGFGQNLIFGLWSNYMLVFYTDIFGIAAGTASIIMLLTRVWDGINDPMMGSIADRTRTKWGRYRPWLLFMAPVIVIFLVLNFSSPDLSPTLKVGLCWNYLCDDEYGVYGSGCAVLDNACRNVFRCKETVKNYQLFPYVNDACLYHSWNYRHSADPCAGAGRQAKGLYDDSACRWIDRGRILSDRFCLHQRACTACAESKNHIQKLCKGDHTK